MAASAVVALSCRSAAGGFHSDSVPSVWGRHTNQPRRERPVSWVFLDQNNRCVDHLRRRLLSHFDVCSHPSVLDVIKDQVDEDESILLVFL